MSDEIVIIEINDALNKSFKTDTVIFTNDFSLLFVKDNPPKRDIDDAIKIVNQFMSWAPHWEKSSVISLDQFNDALDKI